LREIPEQVPAKTGISEFTQRIAEPACYPRSDTREKDDPLRNQSVKPYGPQTAEIGWPVHLVRDGEGGKRTLLEVRGESVQTPPQRDNAARVFPTMQLLNDLRLELGQNLPGQGEVEDLQRGD